MMFLNIPEEKHKELGVYHTHREIVQQPKLWKETYANIKREKENILSFFNSIKSHHKSLNVILTGAGTSAFVGDVVAPYLKKIVDNQVFNIQSIATTNIVSNPTYYLDSNIPTIMVSFARSGNSPESVAAVELGEQLVKDFYQIHITCNKDGLLAIRSENQSNTLMLLMPEGSNDQGFAMTSSFTCMMLSVLLMFQVEKMDQLESIVNWATDAGENVFANAIDCLKEISTLPITNIIYLGSGSLLGLSHEASLKMLELTDGNVFTYFESPLGFRHGPKTILNDDTLAVVFISNDEYTQKYDVDILKELYQERDRKKLRVLAISDHFINQAKDHSDYYLSNNQQNEDLAGQESLDDVWLALPFILYAQILAVYKSLNLNFQPDNPCPSGSVNRVVQGVTIYPFK
jgi:tagatose-6-phosphate ketose/aldose isomerase